MTNDAATIIRELEVVHPAAKLLVMASQQQEAEVDFSDTACLSQTCFSRLSTLISFLTFHDLCWVSLDGRRLQLGQHHCRRAFAEG